MLGADGKIVALLHSGAQMSTFVAQFLEAGKAGPFELPRDRNKTLTALAGAEPVVQAQAAPVQRLQFFLSESTWNAETINRRRLQLLAADPATAP
ncbi:MAG: hypothetical protein ACXWOH_14035, partial [Bdellovibrionota bacterium]